MSVTQGSESSSRGRHVPTHDLPPLVTTDEVAGTAESTSRRATATRIVLGATRIVVGWTFLWAFIDKVFGLGYATPSGKGWLDGGSPTKGYLSGAEGPFKGLYTDLAGTTFANWAFMLGLLGIGLAMTLGIGMRIAGIAGVLLYVLMWTVVMPPETNPLVDDHILGALIVGALALLGAGRYLGLGTWWNTTPLVKRLPWLA
jgi:thiosulfate dehydrogenase [quinone] large subunit